MSVNNFQRDISFFLGGGGRGGSLYFFYNSNRPGVNVLSTNVMIKSELNIQLLSGGKVFNKFIHVRLI